MCWAVDRKIENSVSAVEMKMIRWMSGVFREEKIRNKYITDSKIVFPIVGKMRENKLRWQGGKRHRQ